MLIFEHFRYADTETTRRIVDKNVSYSPDYFPFLYNRTSAHTLQNSACRTKQFSVRNLNHEIFIILVVKIGFYYIDSVFFRRNAVYAGYYRRRARRADARFRFR